MFRFQRVFGKREMPRLNDSVNSQIRIQCKKRGTTEYNNLYFKSLNILLINISFVELFMATN